MRRRFQNVTEQSEDRAAARRQAAATGARLAEEERRYSQDPSYCWCGAKKVRHIVDGHPTAAFECPYHFMPDHQPGAGRGRLFIDDEAALNED